MSTCNRLYVHHTDYTCCAIVCAVWKSLDSDSATGGTSRSFISAPSIGSCCVKLLVTLSLTSSHFAGRFTAGVLLPRRTFVFTSAPLDAGEGRFAGWCRDFGVTGGGTVCCHGCAPAKLCRGFRLD